MDKQLVERLASFASLEKISRKELQWLAEHGQVNVYEAGTIVAPKGLPIEYLYIILSGKIIIHIDRGAGPKLVTEWPAGSVTGMLPYSRMKATPGDTTVEEKAEILAVNVRLHPEMIRQCPDFTAHTVHTMLDRARKFNTSDLQDDKMIALGKLAAGLAHELNNPASATLRSAKLLKEGLAKLDAASRELGAYGLNVTQLNNIDSFCISCLSKPNKKLSPIQTADYQDRNTDWLSSHHLEKDLALSLADTAIGIEELDQLAGIVPGEKLNVVLKWIVASCSAHSLSNDLENSAAHIYKLVDAVKKFTYMDNRSEKEFIDIAQGIENTIQILVSKIKAKNAFIINEIDSSLPRVYVNGSELNQVWLNLIDNALDAIAPSGRITIKGFTKPTHVEVKITDNGPGIPSENISKIFDPFFTTKAPGQGTGLGLDITRRILRQHRGDISVQSQPGRTEFRVNLIAEQPQDAAVKQGQ